MERPIVVEDREELIFLLSEASQLEHMIMCSYLFASFSLKRDPIEGVKPEQMDRIRQWDRVLREVAVQEMMHLAQVTNILTAIGAGPYFQHPNFPQRARYFPPGIQLALLPFGQHALMHFLHLECPEGMEVPDAPEFATPGPAAPAASGSEIVPVPEDFATIGHFYRGIERSLAHLSEKLGEERLFIGPPEAQATPRDFGWPQLVPVSDLSSATTAIENIVEQGEGARGNWQDAHYGRFLEVFQQYQDTLREDPFFDPARPVVPATARPLADVSDSVTLIDDRASAAVEDLFNASYEVLLQMMLRFFIHGGESEGEYRTLSRVAVGMMFRVISPLGELLSRLPVGTSSPGKTVGPTFEIYRTVYMLPHRTSAWPLLQERLLELSSDAAQIATSQDQAELAAVEKSLRGYAESLRSHFGGSGTER